VRLTSITTSLFLCVFLLFICLYQDYELVCPYYRMGCKVSCRRSTLQRHLSEECILARQIKDMDVANTHDTFKPDDYEVFNFTIEKNHYVLEIISCLHLFRK
jgi:hypothetical protein